MANPRTIDRGTKEFKNLEAVAAMLKATSKNGYDYYVGDTYFDYGQDWMWTTIICMGDSTLEQINSWQVGNPRTWEKAINADGLTDIVNAVEAIKAGKFFRD